MRLDCIFWTLFGLVCAAEAGMIGDQCDWTGSGLSSSADRGVTPVYLRCREGGVSWLYPRGALRLLFKPPLPADERDFRVCVRVIRRPDPPDLFHTLQLNDTEAAERFPARIFVEGARRLVPLYAADDGDAREVRCFRSRHGRAALYVEAEPEEGPRRRVATFRYEARPLDTRHRDPATADCRPCTDSEMELAFCTSDLVSKGVFISSEERRDLDTTQLTLRLTKLIRATAAATHYGVALGRDDDDDRDDDNDDDEYFRYSSDNSVEARPRAVREVHAHVQVSAACGAAAGPGEFVVMARRRLHTLALVCAPRAQHWQRLAIARTRDGTAHCTLHH